MTSVFSSLQILFRLTCYCLLISVIVLGLPWLPKAMAAEAMPPVVIAELQTGSQASANEEFIELRNNGDDTVDVSGWHVEYKSATGQSWTVKATLNGELFPGGTYLLASTGYLSGAANSTFASGLAKSGGNIRLSSIASDGQITAHDILAWGNGNSAEGGAPAPLPAEGKSLQRKPLTDGNVQDTNNNLADFVLADAPSPEALNLPPPSVLVPTEEPPNEASEPLEVVVTDPLQDNGAAVAEPAPAEPVSAPAATTPTVLITELLPNPASPVTDSDGEFIELYNATLEQVNLDNYKLQTGLKSSYSFTLHDVVLEPGAYKVLFSKETQLSLSNTSGKARLVAPDGSVVYETAAYGAAKDGFSWAMADGKWVWSAQPTPGVENVIVTAEAAAATAATAKTATKTAKASTTKTTKTTTPKTAKKAAAKTTKTAKAAKTTKPRQVYKEPAKVDLKSPIHYGVLAVIGSLTLLYAAYEYRTDFYNRVFQLRRYLAYRRGHRPEPEGK